jgi:hypothetical protein
MAKKKPKFTKIEKDVLKAIEIILHRMHDMDQKLDHLIRKRDRYNGNHDPHNSTLHHFTG